MESGTHGLEFDLSSRAGEGGGGGLIQRVGLNFAAMSIREENLAKCEKFVMRNVTASR